MERYNIQFLPNIKDRVKINKLRQKLSKKIGKSASLQYPVHMSLISGGFETKDIDLVIKEIEKVCKVTESFELKLSDKTDILVDKCWTGIHVFPVEQINTIRKKLHKIRNRYAIEREKHEYYPPHITLAYPAEVDRIKPVNIPVKRIVFDRVTLLKTKPNGKYKIFKHFKLVSTS